MDDLVKQQQLVDQHVAEGNTDAAVKLLLNMIVDCAKQGNFAIAETLQEKMYDVDAMALTEIVKAAEILEDAKNERINPSYREIWPELFNLLTTEEGNTLFYALRETEYELNEPVYLQGEINTRLFFINRGQFQLFYNQHGQKILLKTLSMGDIAGQDSFFTASVCTTSLTAMNRAKVSFLEKETIEQWEDQYPALRTKLQDYCLDQQNTSDLIKDKGISRRRHKRYKITGDIMFRIFSGGGKPVGKTFRGELSDISAGGLSFFIKTSNKKNANLLLGRKLHLGFILNSVPSQEKIQKTGIITGVINHLFNEYSIHVEFEQKLSAPQREALDQIVIVEREDRGVL